MIEKMQFVSITGPKADIDRVVDQYLSRYEIHLENALAQLQTLKTLTPYLQINPYKGLLAKALEYEKLLDSGNIQTNLTMTLDEAVALIESFDQQLTRINEQKKELEDQKKELEELLTQLEPFLSLDFDISRFLQFRYMTCRFGRISREYYNKFETYVYGSEETLFYPCQKNDRYIWGFYFCPTKVTDRIDAVYASMHFEQLDVPEKLYGIPSQVQAQLAGQLQQTEKELAKLQDTIAELLQRQGEKLYAATRKLESQSRNFDVRRLAACTKEDNREVFYILCGWMSVTDATAFQKEIADDQNLYCFVETDPYSTAHGEPPTKLKNPKIFRPLLLQAAACRHGARAAGQAVAAGGYSVPRPPQRPAGGLCPQRGNCHAESPAGAAAVRARQLRYRGGPDGAGLPDSGRLCPAVCRFPHSVCHPRPPLQHDLPAAACQGGYFAARPHSCARLAGIWQRQFVSEPWFRCHPEGKQRPFLYDADRFRLCLERS